MKDIECKEDIILLVNEFYSKVQTDSVIGYIFTDIAKIDWDLHLPKMYSFWESILFSSGDYKGNPMVIHIDLNRKEKLDSIHFKRWKAVWIETVKSLFDGPKSEEIITRASSIAGLMEFKVQQSNSTN